MSRASTAFAVDDARYAPARDNGQLIES